MSFEQQYFGYSNLVEGTPEEAFTGCSDKKKEFKANRRIERLVAGDSMTIRAYVFEVAPYMRNEVRYMKCTRGIGAVRCDKIAPQVLRMERVTCEEFVSRGAVPGELYGRHAQKEALVAALTPDCD
uniref:Leishmanolysin-like peptidase n=1 Tax=Ascaris lumbricoides TaxID=6252 RepID=A0A0M3HS42_ASCLU